MIRKMDDFYSSYTNLTKNTLAIMESLTDANLNQAIADGHRTLGQIAWHVVVTTSEMMSKTGLSLFSVDDESLPPVKASEILDAYRVVTKELIENLKQNWTDETLDKTDNLYGQEWKRGVTLQVLLDHEIHHRGQMTVLIRQAGDKVKGTMGPAKEEWAQYGMELPAY